MRMIYLAIPPHSSLSKFRNQATGPRQLTSLIELCPGLEELTSRNENMIQPTKIHLAISKRTGTAQSFPHL